MQKGIHPTYYTDTQVVCACGHSFTTGSTLKEIHVDICSSCHPFYTGEQKFVDVEGRIDTFKKKMKKAESERKARIEKLKAKITKEKERQEAPKSLKDMLKNLK